MLKKGKELIKKHIKLLSILLIIVILAIILITTSFVTKTIENKNDKKAEELEEMSYEIYRVDGKMGTAVITFANENGIETIEYKNEKNKIVNCYGKQKVAIDYEMEDFKSYEFKVIDTNQEEKTFTIDFEIPRIHGLYTLKNGIYVNEPDISTGFAKNKTRYIYLNEEQNLVPGNWITDEAPQDWWDYKTQKWANIYVENEGLGSYYIWIPRYCYKVDTENSIPGNERMDVKFINTYNQYIDGITGEKVEWKELEAQGYQIPEAFSWNKQYEKDVETIIPGYWMSKYQLTGLNSYIIDYSARVNLTTVEVRNIEINTDKEISKYTYAIDGKIKHIAETGEDYIFEGLTEGDKTINVTALDSNGEIVGSMTRSYEVAEPNAPDLTGFDLDTTFYVYWDENENEHNEVPIRNEAPTQWYNYTIGNWANIVTRNDGIETYYVWIPRYEYQLNQVSQKSYIKFIKGTETKTTSGYQIPEAFWWDNNGNDIQDEGEQITGYWMTKYQLTSEEKEPKINAEMAAGSNLIRIKDITGTKIRESETNSINLKYEYYLNGTKVHEGTDSKENYIYTGLNTNTVYTINIIARNKDTNEYIAAVTKKIKTIEPYEPDVSSFNKETTYYVTYNEEGTETRTKITETKPENWYDYSNQRWANIVTTANETETYFVWIPRYEYKILSDRTNLSTENRRIDVNFITTEINNDNCSPGYAVPEAFWWDNNADGVEEVNEKLKGYWISKYQLK